MVRITAETTKEAQGILLGKAPPWIIRKSSESLKQDMLENPDNYSNCRDKVMQLINAIEGYSWYD